MSEYGVVIKNSNKETVINSQSDNYMLWFSGSDTATFDIDFNQYDHNYTFMFYSLVKPRFVQFPSLVTTQEPPVVAGYSAQGRAVFGYCTGTSGAWDGFVWFAGWDVIYYNTFNSAKYGGYTSSQVGKSPATATLKYAVFSRYGTPVKKGNYGLQIKRNGAVVFDSRALPLIFDGGFRLSQWGSNDGRTIYGDLYDNPNTVMERINPPRADSWPVLSSLSQRLIPNLDENTLTRACTCITAPSVSLVNGQFEYRLVSLAWGIRQYGTYSNGNYSLALGNDGRSTTMYNTGGGQGGTNMISFARVPAAYQP